MTSALSTVLVVYALGSASPAEIMDAADGLCEVAFVVDSNQEHTRFVLPFMEEMADTFDLADLSDEAIGTLLAGSVQGITTYSEFMLAETARLARHLGLPFHSPEVVTALTDKARQRAVLNGSGVTPLRQVTVEGPEDFERAVREIGLPAVIKPARGTASVDVYPCASWADVRAISPSSDSGDWVVEEMLSPGQHPSSPWLGDYCSVETAVSRGRCWHFAVVERLPLTPPFRETGFVAPDSLPGAYRDQVLEVAEAAIHAVGITTGISHVEIKFTPDGPRVIEVNGRMGGTTGRLLRRASDLDPIRLALEIALDQDVKPREPVFDRCVLAFRVLPPLRQVTVREACEPFSFRSHPGVWAVDGGVRIGQSLDWRRGGLERVFTIWAEADHPAVLPPVIRHLESAAADCVAYDD
ncbi:ATP-grasp domain-containing protein [Sphaerisporangium sp. NPDC051017]|uniref:ATP-grasp domain-containing protein n=1 Tax=Sphaerisporangium sp. NPDC051017 TaxID=3154636 RepID=UPI0034240C4C